MSKRFQNGHTTGQHRSHGAGKLGDGNLSNQKAKNRQSKNGGVNRSTAFFGFIVFFKCIYENNQADDNPMDFRFYEFTHGDDDERGGWKRSAHIGKHLLEYGDDKYQNDGNHKQRQ